jgi:SAM-dependent methyltransferase
LADRLSHLEAPRILVIGGSIDGTGMSILKQKLPQQTIMVESDVAQGPNTNIIFDAHHIPFQANTFDLVIVQAVLEHVLDPFQCVREIERVLHENGIVYAETPFMQQVHGGKYDFHRFTDLGHRRLFRNFEEIDRGLVAGPGSSLAWSLRYFFLSFAVNKTMDRIISYVSSFLVFWLKYFDYLLNHNKGAYDGACGLYFIGTKKTGYVLPDHELLHQYKGYRS